MKRLVLCALAFSALVPLGAQASHCEPLYIYIFSQTRAQTDIDDPTTPGGKIGRTAPSVTSSTIGCTVRDAIADDTITDDPAVHPLTDTDIIYPGSNRLSVRLFENGRDPSVLTSATLEWAGTVYDLEMEPGVSTTGGNANWLHSKQIVIDPSDTTIPNTATATLCIGAECFTRTYRTVAN